MLSQEAIKNKKILIVDDQYGIRLLLTEVFNKEGYQTFQAANGKEAIIIVRKESPDVVLLDMKIPGMDGLEILKHIKKIKNDLKIIMMTAYGELDLLEEAIQCGIVTYFSKPFDIDHIRQAVYDALFNDSEQQKANGEKNADEIMTKI
ncbi:two-component system response regulator [Vulcanibacillus modesticaldus]|uniref:Two-component system response regulator n=1 Tax=Vulcanibacillus modesticaldus TaxID=337097 RepID=A0A1D2YVU8_9BACI|nr:response regulator [Vulcanibacillus modesticaldus]OEF99858.1 two-component system response regulator [Vulcanibacillus modesticaldus]